MESDAAKISAFVGSCVLCCELRLEIAHWPVHFFPALHHHVLPAVLEAGGPWKCNGCGGVTNANLVSAQSEGQAVQLLLPS